MSEVSIEQRVSYWKNKIGIGSVWLLQSFDTRKSTVERVYFDLNCGSVVVDYTLEDCPQAIQTAEVEYFLNYIVQCRA